MNGSNVRHSDAASGANVAAPHAPDRRQGRAREAVRRRTTRILPAASTRTRGHGQVDVGPARERSARRTASRLFSDATYRQITSIVTPLNVPQMPPELSGAASRNFAGYALGLNVVDYRGPQVLHAHRRAARLCVEGASGCRRRSLGVAVLTNQESSGAFDSIVYRVADHYLGAPAFDWSRPSASLQDCVRPRRLPPSSRRPRATRARTPARRFRSRATPAPTLMPGTATSPSPTRTASW